MTTLKIRPTFLFFLFFCFVFFVRAQNTPIHKDLLFFHSDYFGALDSTFTSTKDITPINSLDSNYQNLVNDLKFSNSSRWYWQRIFNKSWVTMKKPDWSFSIDPYYNYTVGTETTNGNSPWYHKRGIFLNAQIGQKINVYSYFYEYLADPDSYVKSFADKTYIMPGEGETKIQPDYYGNYCSAGGINYKISQYLDLSVAHGKVFLGEGYRSILLSDAAAAYPYAKLNLHFGNKISYSAYMAEFLEKLPSDPISGNTLRRKKYAAIHYLDIRLHKKLFWAVSETVLWAGDSSSRNNLDLTYLNPFVMMRPNEYNLGSMDKMQLGTNLKYLPFKFSTLYAQFLLTEYYAKELFGGNNWWGNKYAFQVGGKFHNFPFIKNLYLQLEYNQIRPFTYAHRNTITSYSHLGQPLAHPSGSNLKESILILNYSHKRWNFNYRSIYRISGLEISDSTSIGTDVQRSYDTREWEYNNLIGQGIPYHQWYNSFTVSYLINPSNRMLFEAGVINRKENIANSSNQFNLVFFGVRTGILNNYHDF